MLMLMDAQMMLMLMNASGQCMLNTRVLHEVYQGTDKLMGHVAHNISTCKGPNDQGPADPRKLGQALRQRLATTPLADLAAQRTRDT